MYRLRPYVNGDGNIIASWISDPATFYKWTAGRLGSYPITGSFIDSAMEKRMTDPLYFPFVMEEDSKVVGFLTMRHPDNDMNHLRFGYVIIDSNIRGKGLGKKLIELSLNYAFNCYNATKVSLGVFDNNPNAYHCYKSMGFMETGVIEEEIINNELYRCIDLEIKK